MKRMKFVGIVLFLCMFAAGCDSAVAGNQNAASGSGISAEGGTVNETEYEPRETPNASAAPLVSEHTVSYSCKVGSISLDIPDEWSYKIEKFKKEEDDRTFGISFWPDRNKENKIKVRYTERFGVCGTGLETKDISINGMKAQAGYYDGKPYWEFISFTDEFQNYWVWNLCDSTKWWKQYSDQVMEILDTVKLG